MAANAQLIGIVGRNTRVAAKVCPGSKEVLVRSGILVAVLLFGILAFSGDGIESDIDPRYDFSRNHTFSVQVGTHWSNPLSERAALDLVTSTLMRRGWEPKNQGSADAQVVIHGATPTRRTVDTFYSGAWQGYGWRAVGPRGSVPATSDEYSVGTMVVDVFIAKDKELVFRGVGPDEISGSPAGNARKLGKGVEKMFQNFPPPAKAAKSSLSALSVGTADTHLEVR
jgi:Domain of unknown function (DUF4136)